MVLATPFPPRKPSVTGNTCPATTASNASASAGPAACTPLQRAIRTAAVPLAASRMRVAAPAHRPAVRMTFVAPVLPDPRSRTHVINARGGRLLRPQVIFAEREETTLYDGREWRIHYWLFRKERIFELISGTGCGIGDSSGADSCYEDVPDEVWQRNT